MDVSALVPAGLQVGNQIDRRDVQAGYNKLSENLRKYTPQGIQCIIFCGGSRCKYENPKAWPSVHMAVQNIYSHWVTDDILAMARPNTGEIIKKNLIAQFQAWSIKTIINLQTPGEHASCGGPLESSGFTYDPNMFMENNIYYYNFALKDYGNATMGKLLDMVKVVAFAVQEGRVAIHCHAGLGRTGVLIACYLIYSLRVRTNDAIRFIRIKRPSAIQTRTQIICIREFEHLILPQMVVFPLNGIIGNRRPCTLQTYLQRQHNVLHGYEQRTFKFIPKIIFIICERILQLCDCQDDNSPADIDYLISGTQPFTNKFISHVLDKLNKSNDSMRHSYSWTESIGNLSSDDLPMLKTCDSGQGSSQGTSHDMEGLSDLYCTSPDAPSCDSTYQALDDNCIDEVLGDGIHGQDLFDNDCYKEIQSQLHLKNAAENAQFDPIDIEEAIMALIRDSSTLRDHTKKRLFNYQVDLNNRSTAWQRLELETDVNVLSGLMYEWLETLKHPALDTNNLSHIVVWSSKPQRCLEKMEACNRYLLEYLLRFVCRLRPMTVESQNLICKRLTAALTHQSVRIGQTFSPSNKNYQKLRSGTAGKLNEFFIRFMHMIEEINTQELGKPSWTSKWETVSRQLLRISPIKIDE